MAPRAGARQFGHATDNIGGYWLLIVAGPNRGQICNRRDMGIAPCAPKRDFLSWYESWLDGETQWFREYRYGREKKTR